MKEVKDINDKRKSLVLCFVIYIVVQAFLVINNYGSYTIDEFYSLGSANLSVHTTYNQAPYINGLVRLLSQVFGSSYYVFKMIPITAGFISYSCVMYLVCKLTQKTSTVWITSLAVTFNAFILLNHLNIRNYIFAEAAYMLSMVFLYKYSAENGKRGLSYLYLVLFLVPNVVYYRYTNDSSGGALLGLTLAILVIVFFQNYVDKIIRSRIFWIIAILVLGVVEIFVIAIKKPLIDYTSYSRLEKIHTVLTFYQTDKPIYVLFLVCADLAVAISVGYVIIKIFNGHFEDKKYVMLTAYTVIPMLAYLMFMFNNSMLRCFISYMGAGFVMLACFLDELRNKIIKGIIIVVLVINTAFTYYPFPQGIIEFWNDPLMRIEIYFRDYQEWLDEGKRAANNGYTIVPMMTLLDEEYYFGLDTTESLTMLDEQNQRIRTDDEIVSEFERLMDSGNRYVVMIDTLGRDALIRVGLYDTLKEKYSHTLYYDKWYDDGMSIFYIE